MLAVGVVVREAEKVHVDVVVGPRLPVQLRDRDRVRLGETLTEAVRVVDPVLRVPEHRLPLGLRLKETVPLHVALDGVGLIETEVLQLPELVPELVALALRDALWLPLRVVVAEAVEGLADADTDGEAVVVWVSVGLRRRVRLTVGVGVGGDAVRDAVRPGDRERLRVADRVGLRVDAERLQSDCDGVLVPDAEEDPKRDMVAEAEGDGLRERVAVELSVAEGLAVHVPDIEGLPVSVRVGLEVVLPLLEAAVRVRV